jgi:hypothetical protein
MSIPNDDPYHFVWDITNLVKPGENTLKLCNLKVIPEPSTMMLRNARIEVGKAIAPPPDYVVTPAPTGPLATFVVSEKNRNVPLQVALAEDGGLALAVAGKQFAISTRTSLPHGKWRETATASATKNSKSLANGQTASASWKTNSYNVKREVKVLSDHVHIADTLTNPSKELIGVIVQHRLQYPSAPESLLVAGRMARVSTPSSIEIAEHPSVFAQWPELGLGMIAEDDVFRVHSKSFNDEGGMGLADEQLGIAPGTSVTLEWNIYPLLRANNEGGDYWDFVNTVRRNWGSNITIPGPLAFLPRFNEDDPLQDSSQPAEWYANWVRERGLKILVGNIGRFPDAKYAHGTAISSIPQWVEKERQLNEKLHSVMPDLILLSYFHAQISNEPGGETKYADSRLLDEKSEQLSYPYDYKMPLYLPTRENSYGKALWSFVHALLDGTKTDGLYWDEMTWSMLKYTDFGPWDNHTVSIDPKTHAVIRKRTSVTLAMQPLQLDIVKYLREYKKHLIANSQPSTRTMLNEKIVRFVETQSYLSLVNTHFGTPIGLGNHFDEKDQADTARQIRDMLEYGAVYYADTQYKKKKPPVWPFVSVMFPITPMELHEGMVLGKERIQTARSGRFGWADGAAAEIYVIDGDGNRMKNPPVKEVVEAGKRLYDIRIASDQFAVLVKK